MTTTAPSVTFALVPEFVYTRRGRRRATQTPPEAGIVRRQQLNDYELRSWVLRWSDTPQQIQREIVRLYEASEHGIVPLLYQPIGEPAPIPVTMLYPPQLEYLGPRTGGIEIELVEVR
jgi:hypothetical protein